MTILEFLAPKPLPAYIIETEESKKFYLVSNALNKLGIYGEDNMIETCKILGLKGCCDDRPTKSID